MLLPGGLPLELQSALDSGVDEVSLLVGPPDEGPLDGNDDPVSLDEPVAEPLDAEPDELDPTDEALPDDDRPADDELPTLELGAEELEPGKLLDGALLDRALLDSAVLDAESDDEELLLLPLLEEGPELEVEELLLAPGPEELAGGPLPLGGPALVDGVELSLELDAEALDDALTEDELDDAELDEPLLAYDIDDDP